MMNPDQPSARPRLTAALDGLAAVFGGMTAHPDEHNCECHWGSAEELVQLKVADTELDLDLLGRTWRAPDWSDHASVLRRILPQLATALVEGSVETSSVRRKSAARWPAVIGSSGPLRKPKPSGTSCTHGGPTRSPIPIPIPRHPRTRSWDSWENEETRTELTAWLVRNAPARLRAHGVSGQLLHRIRLLGLAGDDRWEDPHWPGYRY
ncbi:hypothetical protein [Streptomyces hokutonensis]|uniref:hypothetical protein n=1 Tax=Streptomyces hokutonensis TaxID=1306990 RepID=UPI0033DAFD03